MSSLSLQTMVNTWQRFFFKPDADVESESDTGSLPDRLVNPQEYEPVLPTRGELTAAEFTESNEPANQDQRKLSPVYMYGSIK